MSDDGPPVVPAESAAEPPDDGGDSSVFGVILAAGTSSRFGDENKLLAEIRGERLVRRAVRTMLGTDPGTLAGVIVVLGHEAATVREALAGVDASADAAASANADASADADASANLDVTFVENPDHRAGQSTSVRAGVDAVADAGGDAAVFLPGDMPFVAPETVERLVAAYRADAGSAIAAAYHGRRGNPVLFDERHFDALRAVDGDTGGRAVLLESGGGILLDVADAGVRTDVDTAEDLDRHG
ncbi:nucleotidyltransferase family protein [Halorarum halobium]|uniref:nucleotidyltransferase family protein n=1 Tax=Halorarum halobium TaxID=3075121 RepID=UPI0028AD3F9B|nr:nucleotidyltransferase family protein [Halobaculum sp. XH14]